jgi:oxygen-independent coproporphyrinogen-3 oxidase
MSASATAPLGIYVSIPFCRAKCTYCNFASDVFPAARLEGYVKTLCREILKRRTLCLAGECQLPWEADSIYLGGGTPSTLAPHQLRQIFDALRESFDVFPEAEITVECAPGQIGDAFLAECCAQGVNRVSLGVQSFVDAEVSAVGRLHGRATVLADLARLRAAGISNISVDLIAGLPRQTCESWQESLQVALDTGVPHVSVYMLDVDEDSRLGREMLAGGHKYGAQQTPDDAAIAAMYGVACEQLEAGGLPQYEISNFARLSHESRHNLKYWDGAPYVGFGLDAHSCLPGAEGDCLRIANPDAMDSYLAQPISPAAERISRAGQLEERWFLGLRRTRGVALPELEAEFGTEAVAPFRGAVQTAVREGLLEHEDTQVRLTPRGKLFANEVFARFMGVLPPDSEVLQKNLEREMTIA